MYEKKKMPLHEIALAGIATILILLGGVFNTWPSIDRTEVLLSVSLTILLVGYILAKAVYRITSNKLYEKLFGRPIHAEDIENGMYKLSFISERDGFFWVYPQERSPSIGFIAWNFPDKPFYEEDIDKKKDLLVSIETIQSVFNKHNGEREERLELQFTYYWTTKDGEKKNRVVVMLKQ